MPPRVAIPPRLRQLLLSKRVWFLVAVAIAAGTYPFSCGVLGGRLVTSKLSTKLGVPVEYDKARAGWGELHLTNVIIGPKKDPLLTIAKTDISFAAAWGSGTVTVDSPNAQIRYGGDADNVTELLRNETALLESRTRFLAAVHDQRVAATMLEYAAGHLSADSEVLN